MKGFLLVTSVLLIGASAPDHVMRLGQMKTLKAADASAIGVSIRVVDPVPPGKFIEVSVGQAFPCPIEQAYVVAPGLQVPVPYKDKTFEIYVEHKTAVTLQIHCKAKAKGNLSGFIIELQGAK